MLTLHLLEQKYRIVPSFLTCINPVELEKFLPQKEHLNVLGVSVDSLPDLLRFSFCLSQHKNVVQTDRALDVASNNSSLVSSFENSDADLDYFAGYAGAADYLSNFSRY